MGYDPEFSYTVSNTDNSKDEELGIETFTEPIPNDQPIVIMANIIAGIN